jgi:hypothetical protein
MTKDEMVVPQPQEPADPSQAWFWTERWQQMEREADADIAAGRVRTYDNVDEFLTALEARRGA